MTADNKQGWSFAGIAEGYEKYLAPMLSKWTEDLFEKAGLEAGHEVLDIACGTGIAARLAADKVGTSGEITGVDVDADMLTVARSVSARDGVSITWVEADAIELPFNEQSFDVLLCQQGLQFIDEPVEALQQMYRVLRSGGRVALSVWGSLEQSPGYQALGKAMAKHLGEQQAQVNSVPFSMGEAGSLRSLLKGAGFSDVEIDTSTREVRFPSPREFFRREVVSWLAGAFGEPTADERRAVVAELEQSLESYIDSEGLAFPMEVLIASGHRS